MRDTIIDMCLCTICVILTLQVGVWASDLENDYVNWWVVGVAFIAITGVAFFVKNLIMENANRTIYMTNDQRSAK